MLRITTTLPLIAATLLSSGCLKGNLLMKTSDCPDGQVRTGGTLCVSSKLGAGSCEDPDLASVKAGVRITLCDGSIGVGTLGNCSEDGQLGCVTAGDFPALAKNNVEPADIRLGKTIAGITGTKRDMKQCRNGAHLPTWDASGPSNIGSGTTTASINQATGGSVDTGTEELNFNPTTWGLTTGYPVRFTSTVTLPGGIAADTTYYVIPSGTKIKLADSEAAALAGTPVVDLTAANTGTLRIVVAANSVVDLWDTIDDYLNNAPPVGTEPNASPWGSSYLCGASNFTEVSSAGLAGLTPTGGPVGGSQNFTQVWRDELTGLYFTNPLKDGTPVVGLHWSAMMSMCSNLNSGDGAGQWRLPTQKELMQLYVNGVSRIQSGGTGVIGNYYFWSSSAVSGSTVNAWIVGLAYGYSYGYTRTYTNGGALCVR